LATLELAAIRAVQAVATDGWLGIALAEPAAAPTVPTPTAARFEADRRFRR
jgi:hypothetical protein